MSLSLVIFFGLLLFVNQDATGADSQMTKLVLMVGLLLGLASAIDTWVAGARRCKCEQVAHAGKVVGL